jgi:hypothetical protein
MQAGLQQVPILLESILKGKGKRGLPSTLPKWKKVKVSVKSWVASSLHLISSVRSGVRENRRQTG